MSPLKLGLYALTLELSAWAHVLLASTEDATLLFYLAAHGGASVLLALMAIALLPARYTRPRLPMLGLLGGLAFALPLLGMAAIGAALLLVERLPALVRRHDFRVLRIPELDPHDHVPGNAAQAGTRAFLANARAPVAARLKALVALQNVPGRVATPLLRDLLADDADDLRLLAYGMIDSQEKKLNAAIHAERQTYRGGQGGVRLAAARRLAGLYWELVYNGLAAGDLKDHALRQALAYADEVLAVAPDDAGLHLQRGRLLQQLGRPGEAALAYETALARGLPEARVLPWLAELAYDRRDFAATRRLLGRLADQEAAPRLAPVLRYWNPT